MNFVDDVLTFIKVVSSITCVVLLVCSDRFDKVTVINVDGEVLSEVATGKDDIYLTILFSHICHESRNRHHPTISSSGAC